MSFADLEKATLAYQELAKEKTAPKFSLQLVFDNEFGFDLIASGYSQKGSSIDHFKVVVGSGRLPKETLVDIYHGKSREVRIGLSHETLLKVIDVETQSSKEYSG